MNTLSSNQFSLCPTRLFDFARSIAELCENRMRVHPQKRRARQLRGAVAQLDEIASSEIFAAQRVVDLDQCRSTQRGVVARSSITGSDRREAPWRDGPPRSARRNDVETRTTKSRRIRRPETTITRR